MLVKVTREAFEAWQKLSQRTIADGVYRDIPGGIVEFDMPETDYDAVVSGRLQGQTLSELILRISSRSR